MFLFITSRFPMPNGEKNVEVRNDKEKSSADAKLVVNSSCLVANAIYLLLATGEFHCS